ncbi:SIS domain-containing protein [Streptomyces sp. TG1A-8]|uniref:SIS domain-containing protein n=1 Tax=Streptomyces sp. TG1A-8 TaxID=3051385 RepID=UPI00265C5112|nr:SIS domain-containing protein [Streptomyces sp. TG1A-8]MDO0928871.1 SIS domain-containing protein [Streptomyces sp. TG1A-8]
MAPATTGPAPVPAGAPVIAPEVMLRQAHRLADDLRTRTDDFDEQVRALPDAVRLAATESVVIVGDGDSDHAARAVEMAFRSLAGVDCRPVSALPHTHYGVPSAVPGRVLTLAVSASGRTPLVVRAAEQARADGGTAVALTGDAASPLARSADATVQLELPDREPSPGVRTYQASLLGALLLAIRLGQARGRLGRGDADALRDELPGLAGAVEATVDEMTGRTRQLADRIADAPVLTVLGSGPSHGTALYGAAKVIETSAVFATGQDLEEWCHVERFARPTDLPTFVVAPPGRSARHARHVAQRATALGRRLVAVAPADDLPDFAAWAHLPVHGQVREEFSPLLYHLFAAPLACHLAQRLDRTPFAAGRPEPAAGGQDRAHGASP